MNASNSDSLRMLTDTTDMKQHLAALKRVDPVLAREIDATYKSIFGVLQRTVTRSLAARLIMQGLADDTANRLVVEQGTKVLGKFVTGQLDMPDEIRRALEEMGPAL